MLFLSCLYALHLKSHLAAGFCKDGQRKKNRSIIYPRHLAARAASAFYMLFYLLYFLFLRNEHFHFGSCLTPVCFVNLTGHILRVYQGLRGVSEAGRGVRVRIRRLGRIGGNYCCYRFFWGMSGLGEYELVHCVQLSDRPRTGIKCELEFAEISCRDSGNWNSTGGLINAGGPFCVSGGPLNSISPPQKRDVINHPKCGNQFVLVICTRNCQHLNRTTCVTVTNSIVPRRVR